MVPFGAKTTAQQVVQGLDLTGKGALVTGGNSGGLGCPQLLLAHTMQQSCALIAGIGTKTVEALASVGVNVILTSRQAHGSNEEFLSWADCIGGVLALNWTPQVAGPDSVLSGTGR